MRWLPLLLVVAVIVLALGAGAPIASSSAFGHDIWTVRLDTGSSDHWILLDTGHILVGGKPTVGFLLAHPKERATSGQYDAMKVVGGARGATLWTYDGAGSDYVDAGGLPHDGEDAVRFGSAPRFLDVDGDGSDDVVFVEQDFALGRQLRAVRIEP